MNLLHYVRIVITLLKIQSMEFFYNLETIAVTVK